jgi:hypothetical protein
LSYAYTPPAAPATTATLSVVPMISVLDRTRVQYRRSRHLKV